MAVLGLIGAGHIGSQVARLDVANGYQVVISTSPGPETRWAGGGLGPAGGEATATDPATTRNIVVVTIPLKNYRDVPVEPLAAYIVIDMNNDYPDVRAHSRARQ